MGCEIVWFRIVVIINSSVLFVNVLKCFSFNAISTYYNVIGKFVNKILSIIALHFYELSRD